MQLWTEVRHALFVEGISKREAVRRFGLNFRTISKIASQEAPGEYEREMSGRTKLAPTFRSSKMILPKTRRFRASNSTRPSVSTSVFATNTVILTRFASSSTASILYTILCSARRHGLNEFEYLCDILDRLADLPSQAELREMLPDRWKPQKK